MADTEEETNGTTRSTVHWGTKGIAPVIKRTERQTYYLLQKGRIRCARKVGGRWCAGDAALRAEFGIGGEQ
jgi:hypothetical protein